MKEKIFSQKELLIIGMFFISAFFLFYWYELRPYFAKQDCLRTAEAFINSNSSQSFESKYDLCLLRKGYR